jgi:hypothetical protein
MGVCTSVDAPFCLFGFKFENNTGNQTEITYSFYSSNNLVSTHAEDHLSTLNFDSLIPCAKEEIRNALKSYEGIVNLKFLELKDNKNAHLRFSVADMAHKRAAVSFPNFHSEPCKEIAGNIIINPQITGYNCKLFYSLMLHEIGHALGMGHVNSKNIMNPSINLKFQKLQSGDSLGIIKLYGKRDS